jgi:hypothetical protein
MITQLLPAEWDLMTALGNADDLGKNIGAGLLALLGTIAIVTAVIFLFIKLMSENSRHSWVTIIGLFALGGLALAGGIELFTSIAEGVEGSVNKIGQ